MYFMFLEAAFGLCAICLPALSGLLKLKSVQWLVAGFASMISSISSHMSHNSSRSHRSRDAPTVPHDGVAKIVSNDPSHSHRSDSESVAPLTSTSVSAGEASDAAWLGHGGQEGIELGAVPPATAVPSRRALPQDMSGSAQAVETTDVDLRK